ncbi:hypothetical protein ABMA67_00595 [Halobacteriovorax sp. RZ-3]|uniref:hypothetical protein n=1 Tax=Halobacteriovorax sp. RZ-3 TaxID=3157720 RepID=UPI003716AA7D
MTVRVDLLRIMSWYDKSNWTDLEKGLVNIEGIVECRGVSNLGQTLEFFWSLQKIASTCEGYSENLFNAYVQWILNCLSRTLSYEDYIQLESYRESLNIAIEKLNIASTSKFRHEKVINSLDQLMLLQKDQLQHINSYTNQTFIREGLISFLELYKQFKLKSRNKIILNNRKINRNQHDLAVYLINDCFGLGVSESVLAKLMAVGTTKYNKPLDMRDTLLIKNINKFLKIESLVRKTKFKPSIPRSDNWKRYPDLLTSVLVHELKYDSDILKNDLMIDSCSLKAYKK